MKVNIKNHDLELAFTIRMQINYEQKFNKPIDYEHIYNIDIATDAFWACVNATFQKQKIDETISLDDFKDWVDENGGLFIVLRFAKWASKKLDEQWEFMNTQDKENEEKPKSKPKKVKD